MLGVFGAAQGVRGEVRIKSFTADPEAIGAYGALTDKARRAPLRLRVAAPLADDMLVARVEGRRDARGGRGAERRRLFARREQLPPPERGRILLRRPRWPRGGDARRRALGRVVAVNNFGAGDILEIAPEGGGETVLLPFTRAVAVEIDFAGGRIVIEPPREVEGEE